VFLLSAPHAQAEGIDWGRTFAFIVVYGGALFVVAFIVAGIVLSRWRRPPDAQPFAPMRLFMCGVVVAVVGCVGRIVVVEEHVDPTDEDAANADPCGSCEAVPHALSACLWSTKTCVITTCEPGWADCDTAPENGCEVACVSAPCCKP
jgi:hypothetical protein